MIPGLVESARELRNPLTVGYSTLFTIWILFGEELGHAARGTSLGRRLLEALASLGGAFQLALVTFLAAIVGSILWHGAAGRLVRVLSRRAGHPDWPALIDQARTEVRRYEEYEVVTYKGQTGGSPSAFNAQHTVPSPHWGDYLQQRVEERERKAAEMTFRVTLAVALLPVALALGTEGRGMWWWTVAAIPLVWADVALMKYTTLRAVRRYQIQDTEAALDAKKQELQNLGDRAVGSALSPEQRDAHELHRAERRKQIEEDLRSLESQLAVLRRQDARALPRVFAFLEGEPPE